MKQFIAILPFAVLFVAIYSAPAQERVYKYQEGKEYKYLLDETSMTIQEVQGQSMTSNSESTIATTMKVNEIDEDGNMSITLSIDNALVLIETDRDTQTLGDDFRGKSVSFVLTPEGKTLELEESLREHDGQIGPILAQLANVMPRLDASKLSVGSDWKRERKDTTGTENNRSIIDMKSHFKVSGKKNVNGYDCLEIRLTGEADIDGKRSSGDQQMTMKGKKKMNGTLYYALEEGILVQFETETTIDQTVFVSSMNMRVPISSSQTMKYELMTK